jgi:hypothetical protein
MGVDRYLFRTVRLFTGEQAHFVQAIEQELVTKRSGVAL